MNAEVLDGLANALVIQETLSGPALEVYIEGVRRWPEPLVKLRGTPAESVRLRSNGAGAEDDDTVVDGFRSS